MDCITFEEIVRLTFLALAAICNAVMDCIENEHIKVTVFNKYNPNFWYKRESWNKAKRIFGYKFDGWHIAKSLMIIFICLAISPTWKFLIVGLVWNGVFNVFYNHIFKKK